MDLFPSQYPHEREVHLCIAVIPALGGVEKRISGLLGHYSRPTEDLQGQGETLRDPDFQKRWNVIEEDPQHVPLSPTHTGTCTHT